jgi:hypothetical protein
MQIEKVGEVREATTSSLPALGKEPVYLEQPFFFGKNSPKGDTAQIFWLKSLFFLKSFCQIVPLFKERVGTSMPHGYIFNAPREKYCQFREL